METSLFDRIRELKTAKNAEIFAHVYQPAEIYELADAIGDSLDLAIRARESTADVLIFCGVKFMAETAAILNPEKIVLLPDLTAGCPLADCATAAAVREIRAKHPDAAAAAYVNSTAEVKAEVDVIVTSANAVEIVRDLPKRKVIFLPDRNLGSWVASQLPEKEIILWDGCCPIHDRVTTERIAAARTKFPAAKVIVHPECPPAVTAAADFVGGTNALRNHVVESETSEFIVATEIGFETALAKAAPKKQFHFACDDCPDMKAITPEKILAVFETGQPQIVVDPAVAVSAKRSLDRMIKKN